MGRKSGGGAPSPGGAGTGETASDLVKRYFREMQELGETDIYVSPETKNMLETLATSSTRPRTRASAGRAKEAEPGPSPSGEVETRAGGRGRGSRSGARTSAGSRDAGSDGSAKGGAGGGGSARRPAGRRGPSAAEQAAAIAEPEVVEATLAIGGGPATADMFAESSVVDQCTSLDEVERIALGCEKCELSQGRTKVVFGVGNPDATLMFIGEAPGRDEDLSGVPFVGRAGQLLDRILAAAEIPRDNVYIGNIIKCRPPNNRTPFTNEIESCMPYLAKQLACIKPRIICTLGLPATQTLMGLRGSMGSMRGKIYKAGEIVVIPTYHPAAALRDPRYKQPIWEDFLIVKREYDRAESAAG